MIWVTLTHSYSEINKVNDSNKSKHIHLTKDREVILSGMVGNTFKKEDGFSFRID